MHACSDKCFVFFLSCNVCGMQYKGQTNILNCRDNNQKSLSGKNHK